MCKDKEIHFSF